VGAMCFLCVASMKLRIFYLEEKFNMYCSRCGNVIDRNYAVCSYCGCPVGNPTDTDDRKSSGFALLGFFLGITFPIVGLILYLVYESKKPLRAKSVGKGTLIGFISKIIVVVLILVIYFCFIGSMVNGSLFDWMDEHAPEISDSADYFEDDIADYFAADASENNISENNADIKFGNFSIEYNGYYHNTKLDVTVKNTSCKRCSYSITIEAVDKNGARLDTDMIFVDRLNKEQEITLQAFEYVDEEKIDAFKEATFKVLEIYELDY
ncbi:MAG: hypothetical protein K2L36_07315, partial [Eubacterium sp.]|nr:hypothetical protein [Eubacterium sp.]